jgi:hypothetical protein
MRLGSAFVLQRFSQRHDWVLDFRRKQTQRPHWALGAALDMQPRRWPIVFVYSGRLLCVGLGRREI